MKSRQQNDSRVPLPPCRAVGFSVTELMMVIVILAVVAMLAGPSFKEYLGRQKLKGAANEVFSDLQFARSASVQSNMPVTFTFSATGYTIVDANSTNLKTVTLSGGSSISSGTTMVAVFEPVRGTADVTNGPAVVIANSSTPGTVQISVNAMGRPQICSPSGIITDYQICS
jgi:type IV fimbrial biogenesis protein FimT